MRKFLFFLFGLIFFQAFSQTSVSGLIETNTTWSKANSPYNIEGNTLLASGYTLNIEPGVIVNFTSDVRLQIEGEIVAIGTQIDSIHFKSTTEERGS